MEGKRLLRSLTLKNVLSFGPEGMTLDFEPLNVLIGANGSGKSNLIECLALLKSLPRDLAVPLRDGGGIREWIWKGGKTKTSFRIESLWGEASPGLENLLLVHNLILRVNGYRAEVEFEEISANSDNRHPHHKILYVFGDPSVKTEQSALAQLSVVHPGELTYLSDRMSQIQLFRKWTFGPGSSPRSAQKADLPGDFLLEDASNLGLILNEITLDRRCKATLVEYLRKLYEGAIDVRVRIVAGYIETLVEEEDGRLISAARLSDGTLRYLSLLAVLCHPEPPPLICIEEPELGMHPDIIPTIAKLLIEASQRTQLIVTTHSADLISALWEFPESVVVCERGFEGTTMERLDPKRMKKWMERYSLGDLWASGEIGGKRW